MKIEINPMFGKISGKVGDFVFKQINGKTVVCNKPLPRNKSSFSHAEIANHKIFGLNCKLSKCINHIEEYRGFWLKAANSKMSTYNAIQKENCHNVSLSGIEGMPKLTPDSLSLDFSESGFCFDSGRIYIEVINEILGIIKNFKADKYVMATGVISLCNPIYPGSEDFKFINVKSEIVEISEVTDNEVCIDLDEVQLQKINQYESATLYFGFISKDKDGNMINEVSTFAVKLQANEK
jgi:hypothetical protein